MSEHVWTNSTLRRHLGEAGFIELLDERIARGNLISSKWQRGEVVIGMFENEKSYPELYDVMGRKVDPDMLGVRNRQSHNEPTESHDQTNFR